MMKTTALILTALLGTVSFIPPATAQTSSSGTSTKMTTTGKSSKMSSSKKSTKSTKKSTAKAMPKHPKNEITKLQKDRKTDPTVKQVTVDPKKSPGKHADNLSKNINHELNR